MIYLSHFEFSDREQEYDFTMGQKRTCYDTFYPFLILSRHDLKMLDLERDTLYNRSNFFDDYTRMCSYETGQDIPGESRIITSDDVFDFMLNLRSINEGIDRKREELFEDYLDAKYSHFQMKSLDDYEHLKKVTMARSNTQSKYIRKNVADNVREHSNGESAFLYFADKIKENALYLLDEPENSLTFGLKLCFPSL